MSFTPFMVSKSNSVVDHMRSQVMSGKGFTQEDGNVYLAVSVGIGRGASRMILNAEQVGSVAQVIAAFNPAIKPEYYSPAMVAARTLATEGEGEEAKVTFQLSYAPHSRSYSIPVKEWSSFVAFMADATEWSEAAIEHYAQLNG